MKPESVKPIIEVGDQIAYVGGKVPLIFGMVHHYGDYGDHMLLVWNSGGSAMIDADDWRVTGENAIWINLGPINANTEKAKLAIRLKYG